MASIPRIHLIKGSLNEEERPRIKSGGGSDSPGRTKIERGGSGAGDGIARIPRKVDNEIMTEPLTRPELDAKLKTVEVTLDRRIDGIEAKLDGLKDDVASTKSTVRWMTALIAGTIVATAGLVVTSFDSGRDTANMATAAQAKALESQMRADEALEKAAVAQTETAAALSEIRQIVNDLKAAPPAPPSTP